MHGGVGKWADGLRAWAALPARHATAPPPTWLDLISSCDDCWLIIMAFLTRSMPCVESRRGQARRAEGISGVALARLVPNESCLPNGQWQAPR